MPLSRVSPSDDVAGRRGNGVASAAATAGRGGRSGVPRFRAGRDARNRAPAVHHENAAEKPRHWLAASLRLLERFPALSEARDRLSAALARPRPDYAQLVSAIESDVGLTLAVLRAARGGAPRTASAASVSKAVAALRREELAALASRIATFDFFSQDPLARRAEQYRLHALSTQRIAEDVRRAALAEGSDELAVAALLHDIGKVVLPIPNEHYESLARAPGPPGQRLALERRRLAVDHATVGGLLARRLGLSERTARVIERHHASDATGHAAIVQLADMLAHYYAERPVDRAALIESAGRVGLCWSDVTKLLSRPPAGSRRVDSEGGRIPLSPRQREVICGLHRGQTYKQISGELGVSESTVRTHLHQLYEKLGVVDRAQAVLLAVERGWL